MIAGFGLGALNEAEDDDVDVYDSTTRTDRTYMPYDAIRDADQGSGVVSRSKAILKVTRCFFFFFHTNVQTNYRQTTTNQQRFPNGMVVLSGFIITPDPVQKEQW